MSWTALPNDRDVVSLPRQRDDMDSREAWATLEAANLARAYGRDEPDYSLAEINPSRE
jgi:hypothetical protein